MNTATTNSKAPKARHSELCYPIWFGSITFKCQLRRNYLNCQIRRCTISGINELVEKVRIACNLTGDLTCQVFVNAVQARAELEAIAQTEVRTIIDRLAFQNALDFSDPEAIESDIWNQRSKDSKPGQPVKPGILMLRGSNVEACLKFSAEGLQAALKEVPQTTGNILEHFRLIVIRTSAIDRFMGFYQLLLCLVRDKNGHECQKTLDAFILCERPKTPQSESPRKRGCFETIYTRLRNEYSHDRPNVDRRKLVKEMERRNGEMMDLAKLAIRRYAVATASANE